MLPSAAPIVSIRADCGAAIGYGHVMRCLSVACALRQTNSMQVRFIMAGDSDVAPVKAAGFEVYRLAGSVLGIQQIIASIPAADGPLLLDSYDTRSQDLEALRNAGFRVAVFDDGCLLDHYPCELIINSAPSAASLTYNGLPETRLYLGPDYFPLREAFLNQTVRAKVPETAKTIIVTFGGSDHDDITTRALAALAAIEDDLDIIAILGPAYDGRAEDMVERDSRIRILRNAPNVTAIMTSADIAIAGGGGTALELSFLGIPMVMLALSSDQVAIAEAMSAAGAQYLGPCDDVSANDITRSVQPLITDQTRRSNMNMAGRALIDGNGSRRLAEAIVSCYIENVREAS